MWIIEKISDTVYIARYGKELKSISRFDPYEQVLTIQDVGDGIAYFVGSSGAIKDRKVLCSELSKIGFTEVRWIRVERHKI